MLNLLKHVAFILFIVAIAVTIPNDALGDKPRDAIVVLGVIGTWRYAWGLLHFVRCLWFKFIAFPKIRRSADRSLQKSGLGHAFLLVTSFRIDAETTTKVYQAAFKAAAEASGGATVVASIVEISDERLILRIAELSYGDRKPFRLKFVRIPGTGKRDALANGMLAIIGFNPGPNDTVSFIDGDSIVPSNVIEKCASILLFDRETGALTTDEICTVEGADIFKYWYSLRFAQRNILMSSHGLARRVLTLTGRMSMYRASIACDPSFIDQIQNDFIDHWRLGRIRMLTGDDKSTWYWLLSRGYKTLYVPDVQIETIEQPPHASFIASAAALMTRWFGNMLRTNSRAIALGPMRISLFTWWSVIDQRLSMWTCLSGLVLTLLACIIISPWMIAYYVVWVLVSRYILTLSLLVSRPSVSLIYVPLLYFNQIFGSIMKIYVFFRLDRQKWTRQKTSLSIKSSSRQLLVNVWSSRLMTMVAAAAYVSLLAVLMGLSQHEVSSLPVQQIVKLETMQ